MATRETLSIGRMRQNPTEALRRVRDGAEIIITDRGRSVARLVPLEEPTWVEGGGLIGAFAPIGGGYWEDIRRARDQEPAATDPWQRVPR